MKRIILYLVVLLCLWSTHAYPAKSIREQAIGRINRFKLFTNCASMTVIVENVSHHALEFGLTDESIQNAVESRIRSAGLYNNKVTSPYLHVHVGVLNQSYSISMGFNKGVVDPYTWIRSSAATWAMSGFGIHGNNAGYILSHVSRYIDKFLVEFLRVNDEACRKKRKDSQ